MPVACPLSLTRRAYTASVIHNAFRLTEPSSFPPLLQSRFAHSVPSLKSALQLAAKKHAAPDLYVDSVDISFGPLGRQAWQAFSLPQQDEETATPKPDPRKTSDSYSTTTQALQKLLARRVTLSAESTENNQDKDLTKAEEQRLKSVRATRDDLDRWLDILTTHDSLRAATLLIQGAPPPSFVFLYMLRRQNIRPDALRLLIQYIPTWYKATHKEIKHNTHASPVRLDSSLQTHFFRAFLRLLRHCQRVWPQSLEALSVLFTTYLRLSVKGKGKSSIQQVSRLTFFYNRALYLLANPAHVGPFKNVVHQEAAQAILIRSMAEHTPPLVINREGYRGVVRVQLASRKTQSEQEWARLKSPSWPPWKEDRTGMDSHISLDYGVSRARHVLDRMQEAGYRLHPWDRVALIYAGWDTDFSPTIQTRVSLRWLRGTPQYAQFWVARIRTTRTAQQAWACFLAYQDEKGPPSPLVYQAMFHVLIQERKRLRLGSQNIGHEVHQTDADPLYPGDTREIGSPPSSSHQLTYVRVEMPSVQQLFHHMRQDHLAPSGGTLALLLDSAETLEEGFMYLKSAVEEYQGAIKTLFSENIDHNILLALPNTVFSAYVGLLCRFPHTPLNKLAINRFKYAVSWGLRLDQPLFRALYLLVVSKRQHVPSWNRIFRSLARRESPIVSSSWRRVNMEDVALKPEQEMYDRIFAYNLFRQNLATMQEIDLTLDVEAFRYFCIIVEHAAEASKGILQQYGDAPGEAAESVDARHITAAKNMLQDTHYVRSQFWNLVKGRTDTQVVLPTESTEMKLPSLLATPGPAILHSYIRALGLMCDYAGLEELLRWMHQYHNELAERRAEDHNGAVVMRRALTALRVFIEGAWEDTTMSTNSDAEDEALKSRGAPRQQIEEMARLVDEIQDWGGWPSDDEVEVYLEKATQ